MVRSVVHHYESGGELEHIKYRCLIYENIIEKYEKLNNQGLFEDDDQCR